jgi:hypothetical protein
MAISTQWKQIVCGERVEARTRKSTNGVEARTLIEIGLSDGDKQAAHVVLAQTRIPEKDRCPKEKSLDSNNSSMRMCTI